ncbi:hypothetical protein HYH03_001808 [Edaphochlamys debaryana]|uniref:Uncharacterized protein n=1 Tax=Edaphochlamys debaryana TaxID=47281 RepID=A0A836C4V1_9CHLO|nr:hypothetical protein HYH03_001808 [Edaphochlamys debaryana]|eukprot:KAG2500230.1 hypothetical protein HYH03_001808 [Edaphochlamys debaryana]
MDSVLPEFALNQPWHIQVAHWVAHVAGLALGKALGLVLVGLGLAILASPFWIAWKVARALLRVLWRCVRWALQRLRQRSPRSAAAHGKGAAQPPMMTESADAAPPASTGPAAAGQQGLRRRPRPAVTATAATEEAEAEGETEAVAEGGMQAEVAVPSGADGGSGVVTTAAGAECSCMPGELPCRLHSAGGLSSVC